MSILAGFILPHPPLIIPDIGRGEERRINTTISAITTVVKMIDSLNPQSIILISPHKRGYQDAFSLSQGPTVTGHFGRFGCPDCRHKIQIDVDLTARILEHAANEGIKTIVDQNDLDHGVLVPLHFIDGVVAAARYVIISLSGYGPLEHYRFGCAIKDAVDGSGKSVVMIASGDLSHKLKEDGPYGFTPEGSEFDRRVIAILKEGPLRRLLAIDNVLVNKAAQCGLDAFRILAGSFDGIKVIPDVLSYEAPFGVGYAVATITPLKE